MTRHTTVAVCAVALLLTPAVPVQAGPIWFDETGGGSGFATFGAMQQAYGSFVGVADQTITFSDLHVGTALSDQYAASHGVRFSNTVSLNKSRAKHSGVRNAGDGFVEDLTGYDGSYMPRSDRVYLKFDNDAAATPFTFTFDQPVSRVGSFVAMGVEGQVHTLQVSLYGLEGTLLDSRVVDSWLWESKTKRQNYESFWAVDAGGPLISRVEILNLATSTNYANALTIDNIGFSHGAADKVIPEPSAGLTMLAGLLAWRAVRRR